MIPNAVFKCPQCKHKQTCPCPPCQSRKPTEKPWIWKDDTTISCGECGLTHLADWWADEEYNQLKVSTDTLATE